MTLTPPLKWHGGKTYLAPEIIKLMPSRCKKPNAPDAADRGWLHYVEPYFGGGAVLLANDPEGISEVANDLNGELSNFWQVLADKEWFVEFERMAQATPFAEAAFKNCRDGEPLQSDRLMRAMAFFIRVRQSLAGRQGSFAGITRNRTRRGMNEQASAWLNAVEGLPAVHERLKRVVILNKPALNVIRAEDGPRTLFYLDPPYLHETRATTKEYGEHEMDEDDHGRLLLALQGIKGKAMLSGYRSEFYDAGLHGWHRHEFDLPNNSAGGKEKRRMTECVWTNF